MPGKLIREFSIPKCDGRAFELRKGQVLRVIEVEGKQVGDMTALNLHDFREVFSPEKTVTANRSFRKATKLYSQPPYENVMLTVIHDKVGVHWIHGRCSPLTYRVLFNLDKHRSCQEILAECLAPHGILPYQVPGTFNIFMHVQVDQECRSTIKVPVSSKGDYIDFLAEMDLLVAISACPSEVAPTNDYLPKSLGVQILEGP